LKTRVARRARFEHIHLRDEAGQPVELPFLEIDEELWNPDMTRLTLFIDPGRIKRGVKPLEEIGPALEESKRYTLEIDAAWHDSAGLPLRESFLKPFRAGAPAGIDAPVFNATPPYTVNRRLRPTTPHLSCARPPRMMTASECNATVGQTCHGTP